MFSIDSVWDVKFSLSLAVGWSWKCWYWWLTILYKFKIKVLLRGFLSVLFVIQLNLDFCFIDSSWQHFCFYVTDWLYLHLYSTEEQTASIQEFSRECYRCCSSHSNRNSGKGLLVTHLHTCNQKISISILTLIWNCNQTRQPPFPRLTGPTPCSCLELPGSHNGWRRGPATAAPRGRTGWARGSWGCSPPPWSPSQLCSAHLDSLAPPWDNRTVQ